MNRVIARISILALVPTIALIGCNGFSGNLPDALRGATYNGVVISSTSGVSKPRRLFVRFAKDQSTVYIDDTPFK